MILVSAQGPNPFFSYFGGTFIRLGGLFGQGLGLGPGLDNIRKTLVVSLLPLICSFLHSTFNDQRSWYWLHLRMNPQVCVFTQLDSCRLKNDKTTKRTTEAESTKSFFLPLVSLRQTWHKSLE